MGWASCQERRHSVVWRLCFGAIGSALLSMHYHHHYHHKMYTTQTSIYYTKGPSVSKHSKTINDNSSTKVHQWGDHWPHAPEEGLYHWFQMQPVSTNLACSFTLIKVFQNVCAHWAKLWEPFSKRAHRPALALVEDRRIPIIILSLPQFKTNGSEASRLLPSFPKIKHAFSKLSNPTDQTVMCCPKVLQKSHHDHIFPIIRTFTNHDQEICHIFQR